MDRKTLIGNLHALFCDEYKQNRKYAKVWLSHGCMRYVLHVEPEQEITSFYKEIEYLVNLLRLKAKTEWREISTIRVHYLRERYTCERDDYMVFESGEKCTKCHDEEIGKYLTNCASACPLFINKHAVKFMRMLCMCAFLRARPYKSS